MDNIVEELRISIEGKLVDKSPSVASCSIFRVPELIRRHNVEAYVPNVVSIGPYHKGGRPQFQLMQNVKRWYLQCLLKRCLDVITLDRLIKGVMELADHARDSYDQELESLSVKEFVEIMVLDGCFLLELFTRAASDNHRDENDPIFHQDHMLKYLCHDLLLLENQIPWFVLECLHKLTSINVSGPSSYQPNLLNLVVCFFLRSLSDDILKYQIDASSREPFHILDLIRSILLHDHRLIDPDPVEQRELYYNELHMSIPNATTLEESGFKFSTNHFSLMEVQFNSGVFRIPFMNIGEMTEVLLRNTIALEQCHHNHPHMVTSYAFIMGNLIHSTKDIDLLCNKGIMTVSSLSHEDAFKMFNNLCKDTATRFYHGTLFKEVNVHYRTPWNVLKDTFRKWMKNLKRDYFSTPWKVISWIAAFILLILTLLQTLYTMKQYYNPK